MELKEMIKVMQHYADDGEVIFVQQLTFFELISTSPPFS